ncbi:hypothetical protein N9L47_04805 [Rhodobacteraceae bacterium]|nr:hypothetical protein [Paracoccaceae bacterium]
MPDFILEMRDVGLGPGRSLNDLIVHLQPSMVTIGAMVTEVGSGQNGPWARYTVSDATEFEHVVIDKTVGTKLNEAFDIRKPTPADVDDESAYRSIEVYYSVPNIPDGQNALDFRNEAMELIEAALGKADAGEWAGAESGANFETGEPEVNFGFEVEDFDRAEKIVRDTVRGTPFDCIREITRYDSTDY